MDDVRGGGCFGGPVFCYHANMNARSGHVVDSQSRVKQLDHFFRQQTTERRQRAERSARKATEDVLADARQSPGRVIASADFCRLLVKLNPSLMFEQTVAYPDQGGIYVRDDRANLDDLNPRYRGYRFVTGFDWGMMPEHPTIVPGIDAHGESKPRVTRKGWRMTLKVLIQARLVTLAAVERMFGGGGKGWHQQLH